MNTRLFFTAACAVSMLTGCVSYTGQLLDTDEIVDQDNQEFASAAQKAFEARMKAPPRPVVVTEAPEMGIFLNPSSSMYSGHPLCNDINVRKEAALAFKAQLRQKVSSIKDFKLVEEAQAVKGFDAVLSAPAHEGAACRLCLG